MRSLSCLTVVLLCAGLARGQADLTVVLPLVPQQPAGFQPDQCSIHGKQLRLVTTTRVEKANDAPLLVAFDAVEAPPSKWLYEAVTYLEELAKAPAPVTVVIVDPEGVHLLHSADTDAGVLGAALDRFNTETHRRVATLHVPFRQPEGAEREAAIQTELEQLRRLLVSGLNLKDPPTRVQQQLAGLASLPALFGEHAGRKAVVWVTFGFAITFENRRDLLVTQRYGYGVEIDQQLANARLISTRWQQTIATLNRANVSLSVFVGGWFKPSIRDEATWFRDPVVDELLYRNTGGAELRSGATLPQAVKEAAGKLNAYYREPVRWTPIAIKCKGQGRVETPKGFFAVRP